jgi:hypothetical protein
MTARTLSPDELRLARHALGLPNDRRCSYRNRYYVSGPNSAWLRLVADGLAEWVTDGRMICYGMTGAGARLALQPGETLDPEDFSEAAQ